MTRYALTVTGILLLATTGCLIFNPSEVSLTASPMPVVVTTPEPSEPQMPYGPPLTRVIRQQDKVLEALDECDWSDVIDEAGDWTEYVRVLSGYADTSHDRVLSPWACRWPISSGFAPELRNTARSTLAMARSRWATKCRPTAELDEPATSSP